MRSGEPEIRPWFFRWLEATRLSVPVAAGLLALALLAVNLLVWVGGWGFGAAGSDDFPEEVLLIFPIATFYMLVTGWACLHAAREDLAQLRRHLACSDEQYEALARRMTRFPRRPVVTASLVGLGIPILLDLLSGASTPPLGPALLLAPQALLFWSITAATAFALVSNAVTFRRVGSDHLRVDLFDRRPLQAFVRVGLRLALVLLGFIALRVAFYAYSAPIGVVLANLGPMFVVLVLATAALLLPMWGVRERMVAAKEAELARVNAEIARRGGASVPRFEAEEGVPRALLNLLDYREKVEGVRTWPFDAPALIRFLAYLSIPIGAWIGGALVERLVDALIG